MTKIVLLALIVALLPAGPAGAGWNPFDQEKPENQAIDTPEVAAAIAKFKNSDPNLQEFFNQAYGYAIFPTVAKGGIGLGGAYGRGEVYQQGKLVGHTSLSQLTIGFQLGGQAYSEIIFFKDRKALSRFTSGSFEFGAQASAVAVTAGASADADYNDGVAIFTLTKGGLMYEAAVGGQKFTFTPQE